MRWAALSIRLRFRPRSLFCFPAADCGDPLANRNLEATLRPSVVVEIRKCDLRQSLADRFLDGAQIVMLVRRDEGECIAYLACPRRATDAVDVVVGRLRHIEVDDVSERFDVDSARGDVRRNQDSMIAALESRERGCALALRAISVNSLGLDATFH